jgi:hypothetical protein
MPRSPQSPIDFYSPLYTGRPAMQTAAAIQQHLISPHLAAIVSEYVCPARHFPITAATYGHYEYVEQCIATNRTGWEACLSGACENGYLHIVKLLIAHGATDVRNGLLEACRNGHPKIVDLMIDVGATNLNAGLREACLWGHLDVAILLVTRGARHWTRGLYSACRGGSIRLAGYMMARGADDLDTGLTLAHMNHHRGVVRLMIHHGATNARECHYAMSHIARALRQSLV